MRWTYAQEVPARAATCPSNLVAGRFRVHREELFELHDAVPDPGRVAG